MSIVSSMVRGEKPLQMREVMRGAYWYQRPRRLARISMRPTMGTILRREGFDEGCKVSKLVAMVELGLLKGKRIGGYGFDF
ncbi:hypothetical protein ACSQ67_026163 [Phaseolus vulgaris]